MRRELVSVCNDSEAMEKGLTSARSNTHMARTSNRYSVCGTKFVTSVVKCVDARSPTRHCALARTGGYSRASTRYTT